MEVILTGTGSPLPDANRAGPSTLVKAGDTHVLVDAGRGVVMRMAGAGSLPGLLAGVLVTHLHSDHICALNDVITTHWVMSQGKATLPIYGTIGTAEFVDRQLHALEPDIGYRMEHHDLLTNPPLVNVTELAPGDSFALGDVKIDTAATEHAPVRPTIGFRIEHDGSTAALVGDTIPCDGVDELARNADVYVQTVIRRDLVEMIPAGMMQDILDYHSGVVEAAQTAERVAAKRLALTHMVPAPTPERYPEWMAIAAEHYSGEVIVGDDLTTVTI
ncbi:MAG: MBL fold metallo-hydrolase [Actinomycetota bacterium]|nr:MBL fold metallo-hydrolase [Actinomycetota bacterium]MED5233135.1 MBL fold metallo-hydrolase [Actinomycetota bacterium]MEE3353622.1 MBL fold metallo-hydrolase [Actinomycetota bacterium]